MSAGDCRDAARTIIGFVCYAIHGILQQLTYQYQFQHLTSDILLFFKLACVAIIM